MRISRKQATHNESVLDGPQAVFLSAGGADKKQKSKESTVFSTGLQIALILLVLYLVSLANVAVFHILVEIASLLVALMIFVLAFNSRWLHGNTFLTFLGVGYLFIGGIELIHLLTNPEFAILKGYDINISQQLRIAGRFLESLSFLLALSLFRRKISFSTIFWGYTVAFVFLLLTILYWKIFPLTFTFESGAAVFKNWGDGIVVAILSCALAILIQKRREFSSSVFWPLSLAIAFQAIAVSVHTPYTGAYSATNFIGLSFRLVSFFLLYKAVIVVGLMKPYEFLFKDLVRSQEKLQVAKDNLKERVELRTAELKEANLQLKRDKEQLIESYRHLGITNRKISFLLDLSQNHREKRKKKKTLDYILTTILNLSRATAGILYRYDGEQKLFQLLLAKNVKGNKESGCKTFSASSFPFFQSLVKNPRRIYGESDQNGIGRLNFGSGLKYFILLPLEKNGKLAGIIFLGYKNKKT